MIKVLFVCHGNICRSPMAESVFTYLVKQQPCKNQYFAASAATSLEEIGNPPHYGTVSILREHQIPLIPHHAVQMTRADYARYDYLIGMDTANLRNMSRICGGDPEGKIVSLSSFAGLERDIADPWYTGNFIQTYQDILLGCQSLLSYLENLP